MNEIIRLLGEILAVLQGNPAAGSELSGVMNRIDTKNAVRTLFKMREYTTEYPSLSETTPMEIDVILRLVDPKGEARQEIEDDMRADGETSFRKLSPKNDPNAVKITEEDLKDKDKEFVKVSYEDMGISEGEDVVPDLDAPTKEELEDS